MDYFLFLLDVSKFIQKVENTEKGLGGDFVQT